MGGREGRRIGEFLKQKKNSPKSNVLADKITTKETKPRPVSSADNMGMHEEGGGCLRKTSLNKYQIISYVPNLPK